MKNKLLNFTICQVLVVIGMLVSCAQCQEQKLLATENVTLFDRSFEKVLSRRKRFLVWRPGSNLLLTGSLVKPLAFSRPTGHNLILEWDLFYPLPTTWRLPKKPTPSTTPPPETTTEIVDYHDHHDDHSHGDVWMPNAGWADGTDVLQNLGDENTADKRYWNSKRRPELRRNDWGKNNLLRQPLPQPVTQYRNPLIYQQPWQSDPHSRNERINFNQRYYQSNRQTLYPERESLQPNKQRQMSYRKGRSLKPTNNDDDGKKSKRAVESMYNNWEHHYAHRDRRDLYERIESASPLSSFDVKSCLLRAICESQNLLHPPGYSMLQDMMRAVFTIPIMDGMDDDYSDAMQANDRDCLHVYSEKCPISILAFLLRFKT